MMVAVMRLAIMLLIIRWILTKFITRYLSSCYTKCSKWRRTCWDLPSFASSFEKQSPFVKAIFKVKAHTAKSNSKNTIRNGELEIISPHKLLTLFSLPKHCVHRGIFAYIYCYMFRALLAPLMWYGYIAFWASEQNIGWRMDAVNIPLTVITTCGAKKYEFWTVGILMMMMIMKMNISS